MCFASTNPANAITRVVLASASAAFETGNLFCDVVPGPSTVLCTVLRAGGAIVLARRRASVRQGPPA